MALTQIVKDGLGANLTATSEGGAVTTSVQQGLAKSWGDFNQATPAVLDSLNTTSITDTSAGRFTPNLINNMSSANYPISSNSIGNSSSYGVSVSTTEAKSSSGSPQQSMHNTSGSLADLSTCSYVYHGDLA